MNEVDGGIEISDDTDIRTLLIDRPERRNALTPAMYETLAGALADFDADPGLRVVILRARGEHFCAGNDLDNFLEVTNALAEGESDFSDDEPQARLIHAFARLEKPLVAAVDGAAIGIGFTLLIHADIVVATAEASFGAPFGLLGLCPEAGSSLALPHLLGRQRALEVFLLGRRLTAEELLAAGLVNRIVAAESLQAVAREYARALSRIPAHAVQETRRLVDTPEEPMASRIDRELAAFGRCLARPETRKAITAVRNP